MAVSTSSRPPNLTFMDLPLELREDIYSRVFLCNPKTAFYNPTERRHQRCQCLKPFLMLVCRSIRQNVLAEFYRTHEVHFILFANTKATLLSWLSRISADELAMVQCFRLKSKEPCRLGHRPRMVKAFFTSAARCSAHSCCLDTRVEMQYQLDEIVEALPRPDGRVVLTKDGLRQMFEVVGWFEGCYDLL